MVVAVAVVAGVSAPVAAARSRLGLPSLDHARRYIVAPASREVVPVSVRAVTPTNYDFVTASSRTSEEAAHDLDADPSSTTEQRDGTAVREAGPRVPGAEFSYVLRVPRGGPITIRVEESGSATSDYWVLVNGLPAYHRTPDPGQSGTWHDLVGLVHYRFRVPAAALRAGRRPGRLRVAFRNADDPGPGARIASVWANGRGRRSDAPYGGLVERARGALSSSGARLRSELFGRPYLIVDFGREVSGQVELRARTTERTRLGLAFSEAWQYMTTTSDFSQDPPGIATETHLFDLSPGTRDLRDPVIRGGFRYLMVFLARPGAVELSRLRLHFTAAPLQRDLRDYRGSFLSSRDALNRMWYAGAYTVQTDTIDPHTGRPYPAKPGPVTNDATVADGPSFVSDGAKRDRMDWAGDLVVSHPIAYLSTADAESPRHGIEWLAAHPSPSGQQPGIYLPDGSGFNYSWGEYAAWFVRNYWTHYLYTGDRVFLDRWFSTMQADIGWFESLVGADGLVDVPPSAGGHWGYGDSGRETYDNAVYVLALHDAARVAEAEGRQDLADRYRAYARRTADAINAQLWDARAGAYVLSAADRGHHPQDANAVAVVAGVATGDRARSALRFLRSGWETYGSPTVDSAGGAVPRYVSPFVSYFELLARASLNDTTDTAAAMELLRRTWGRMLTSDPTGTFWENLSLAGRPQLGSYTSHSHGWGAGATPFLTNQVLGVMPTSGGFATFDALPHPDGSLRWAEGSVPTPAGPVVAAWRQRDDRFALEVDAPPGERYTAGVPSRSGMVVRRDGRVVWAGGRPGAPDVVQRDGYVEVLGARGTTRLTATYAKGDAG